MAYNVITLVMSVSLLIIQELMYIKYFKFFKKLIFVILNCENNINLIIFLYNIHFFEKNSKNITSWDCILVNKSKVSSIAIMFFT